MEYALTKGRKVRNHKRQDFKQNIFILIKQNKTHKHNITKINRIKNLSWKILKEKVGKTICDIIGCILLRDKNNVKSTEEKTILKLELPQCLKKKSEHFSITAHDCHLSTQKAEAGGCTFEASLEYLVRSVSKKRTKVYLLQKAE